MDFDSDAADTSCERLLQHIAAAAGILANEDLRGVVLFFEKHANCLSEP